MTRNDAILAQLISGGLLPPPVSTLHEVVNRPGFKYPHHIYQDEVEIVYVQHGASYVGINNQFIRIRKNDCLIIFPKVTHNYFLRENESCKIIDLVFKPGDLNRFDATKLLPALRFLHELLIPQMEYLKFVDNGEVKAALEHILQYYPDRAQEYAKMLTILHFCELYVLLSKVISETRSDLGKPKNPYVMSCLDYLANFYTTQLTTEDITRQVGLSPQYFSRLFTQEMGMTVRDYLCLLRIRKAKDLLQNSDMDITRIAYSVGFNSSQYFTTCFKNIEHLTPGDYRRLVRTER